MPTQNKFHLDKRAGSLLDADPRPEADDQLLTTREVAAYLGMSEQWVTLGRSKKYGPPFVRVGSRRLRYRKSAVRTWLEFAHLFLDRRIPRTRGGGVMTKPKQPGPSNRKSNTVIAVLALCFIASLVRGPQAPAASASNDVDAMVRKVADDVRVSMEKQALAYKRSLVPHWLYAACVRWNSSYVDANDCLDKVVLTLPTGSVPGTWRLDANSQAEKRVYWSFADCDSSRVQEGSSVCVTN